MIYCNSFSFVEFSFRASSHCLQNFTYNFMQAFLQAYVNKRSIEFTEDNPHWKRVESAKKIIEYNERDHFTQLPPLNRWIENCATAICNWFVVKKSGSFPMTMNNGLWNAWQFFQISLMFISVSSISWIYGIFKQTNGCIKMAK